MRQCTSCGEVKELSKFGIVKDGDKRYFMRSCKSCAYLVKKKWRHDNPEIQKKMQRDNYAKNSKKLIAINLAYQNSMRDKYGFGMKPIRMLGLKLTLFVYDRAGRKCELCGEENDLVFHHKDNKGRNYIDLGLKPNNDPDNIQLLCRSCHGSIHGKQGVEARRLKKLALA